MSKLLLEGWQNYKKEAKRAFGIDPLFRGVIEGDYASFVKLKDNWIKDKSLGEEFATALKDLKIDPLTTLFQHFKKFLDEYLDREVKRQINDLRFDEEGIVMQCSVDLMDLMDEESFINGLAGSAAFRNSQFNTSQHRPLFLRVYNHIKNNSEAVINFDIMYDHDDELISLETEVSYHDLEQLETDFNDRLEKSNVHFQQKLDYIDGATWAPFSAFFDIAAAFHFIASTAVRDLYIRRQDFAGSMGDYALLRMEEMQEEIYENKLYGKKSVESSVKTYFPDAYIKNMRYKNWDVYRVSVAGESSSYALTIKLNYDRNLLEIDVKDSDQAYGATFNAYEKTGLRISNLENELNYLYYRIIQ